MMFNVYYRWRSDSHLTLIITYTDITPNKSTRKKFSIPLLAFDNSLDSLYSISHDIQIFTPSSKSAFEKYSVPSNTTEECLPIIVCFKRANAYLIYVPLWLIEKHVAAGTAEDSFLGGIKINLNETYVAPISNPFFGFTPESDSPEPLFYSDYFFRLVNFKEKSFLLSYHLKSENLRKIPELANILGLRSNGTTPLGVNMDSVYETVGEYMYTTSVITVKQRPIAMTVIPNAFPANDLEHQMLYVSRQNELFAMNFTSYMNVRVKSFRLASRMLTLNVSGVLNQNVSVVLNFKGFANSGFLDDVSSTVRLIFLAAIALLLSIALLYMIDKDVNTTRSENHRVLLRHSLKPITSAIGDLASMLNPQKDPNDDSQQRFDESDDSDEAVEICANLIKAETVELRKRELSKKLLSDKVIRVEARTNTTLQVPGAEGNDALSQILNSDTVRARRSLRPAA